MTKELSDKNSFEEVTVRVDSGLPLSSSTVNLAKEIIRGGVEGLTIGYGKRENEISRVSFGRIDAYQQLPIASASKFLVAATVMALVDEGKLSLDQSISHWLPMTSEEAGHITLRHLLSQTSGLAGAKGEFYDLVQDSRMTLAQSCHDVTRRPLVSRPGEVFEYGGPGFQVVGAVVEAVTGKVWADVFQEKISGPLGMSRTYWTHLRPDLTHDLPSPEMLNPVLQGGAVSTAEDYMHFLSMLSQEGLYRGKRILSSSSVKVMLSDQTSAAHMTPSGANVLPDAHYSLGNWCETWDNQGHCNRSSSIGVFGTYPWIEQKTQNFGIIFVYIRDNAFRFWKYFEEIRDSINELS